MGRRPPPPKPPRRDDPNQLNFFDRLRSAVINADVSKGALFGALGVSIALLSTIVSIAGGVLSLTEAFIPCALLIVFAIVAFFVEAKRSKGLEAKVAYRWHIGIGVAALWVPAFLLIYSVDKAHTQEQARQVQEQQRRLDEQRERGRQKLEQEKAEADKERIKLCEATRSRELPLAKKRKDEAHAALVICTDQFERQKKTAEDTIEQRCRSEWNASQAANQKHRAIAGRRCDGS